MGYNENISKIYTKVKDDYRTFRYKQLPPPNNYGVIKIYTRQVIQGDLTREEALKLALKLNNRSRIL